jgi:predicted Zn-dependent protease
MLSYTRSSLFQLELHEYYDEIVELMKTASETSSKKSLSGEELEKIYGHAYHLFVSELPESARTIFRLLTERAPNNDTYWRALGIVNYELKNYADALNAFGEALKRNPGAVICRVYYAELQIITGKIQEGIDALKDLVADNTLLLSKDPFLARAQILLQRNAPKE